MSHLSNICLWHTVVWHIVNIFVRSAACLFTFSMMYFWRTAVCSFHEVQFMRFSVIITFVSTWRPTAQIVMVLCCLLGHAVVSCCTLTYMTDVDWHKVRGLLVFYTDFGLLQHHCWKGDDLPPFDINWSHACQAVSGLPVLPLRSMSMLAPVPLSNHCSFIVGHLVVRELPFLVQICLALSLPSYFHINF